MTTTTACPSCTADLDHCHGVLVLHADGGLECRSDLPCTDLALGRHDWRHACVDLGERCPCDLAAAA